MQGTQVSTATESGTEPNCGMHRQTPAKFEPQSLTQEHIRNMCILKSMLILQPVTRLLVCMQMLVRLTCQSLQARVGYKTMPQHQ